MHAFHELGEKGVVSLNAKMGVIKGPNWKQPVFVTQRKYGIE